MFILSFSANKQLADEMRQFGNLIDLGYYWYRLECETEELRDNAQLYYLRNK